MIVTKRQFELAQLINMPSSNSYDSAFTAEEIIENGLSALLLEDKKLSNDCETIQTIKKVDHQLLIIHELQFQQFKKLFTVLNEAKIPFVVLKGWALSHSVYHRPHQRPKTDIDILIPENYKSDVIIKFEQLNYVNPRGWEPKAIIDQFTMRKPIAKGINASVDVHLKISDDNLIHQALSWDYVYSNALTNNALSAKIPCKSLLIMHASVHLLHHYTHGDFVKLIWLYDIHLIIKECSESDILKLAEMLSNTNLAKPIKRVIQDVFAILPSSKTQHVLEQLEGIVSSTQFDYLLREPSLIRSYIRKLNQTEGLRLKLAMLREIFFPPKEEIFRKYGKVSSLTLPYYYILRIVSGTVRRLF